MQKSRYTDQQIALALKQAEAGGPVLEVCRKYGITVSVAEAPAEVRVLYPWTA